MSAGFVPPGTLVTKLELGNQNHLCFTASTDFVSLGAQVTKLELGNQNQPESS